MSEWSGIERQIFAARLEAVATAVRDGHIAEERFEDATLEIEHSRAGSLIAITVKWRAAWNTQRT